MACVLAAGGAAAGPTAQELEEKLLPILVFRDIVPIRMAGLDGEGDQLHASDLALSDQGMWDPGLYTVRCRVFFKTTEDAYAQVPLSTFGWWKDMRTDAQLSHAAVPPGAFADRTVYVRVARKGERVAIRYEFETERKDGQWEFSKEPYRGKMEWPGGVEWPVRARSCWEEWGRQLGKTVEFYGSEDELKRAEGSKFGMR
jgi:hypothetical protein